MKKNRGFTLIEVVIAISIFALLGFGCYKVVHGLSLARDSVSKSSEELRQFVRAINIINDDFSQLSTRKILSDAGHSAPAFDTQGDYLVEFSRIGVRNPLMAKRAKVVRIAYQFEKEIDTHELENQDDAQNTTVGDGKQGYLIRYDWPVLDRGNNDPPGTKVLLAGVKGLELEYMDQNKKWVTSWPPTDSQNNSAPQDLPYAIKFKLDTVKYGLLERLFAIRKLPKS